MTGDRWATSTDGGPMVEQTSADAAYKQAQTDDFAGLTTTAIYLDEGCGWTLYTTCDHVYARREIA